MILALMAIATIFLFMSEQANAKPTRETFFYSDSREALFMTWIPGDGAMAAAEDYINWVNHQIGENMLVVDDDTRIFVVFRARRNLRILEESNVFFPGHIPGPIVGLIVYDKEAGGMTIVEIPYQTIDVEHDIESKRKRKITSVSYVRKVRGVEGEFEVDVRWIQVEASVLPESGFEGHTVNFAYFRGISVPGGLGTLYLVKNRLTRYILFDGGVPTANFDGKLQFASDFSKAPDQNIDYDAIFGDPGNILDKVSAYAGEEVLYECD
jgi:hypothetical protein